MLASLWSTCSSSGCAQASDIDEVIVTNTVPLENHKLFTNKIRTVDISILIAEAIR